EPAEDRLFTENETNTEKVTHTPNASVFTKDAFNEAIINGQHIEAMRNARKGTKFSPVYRYNIAAGGTQTIYCRLSRQSRKQPFAPGFASIFETRRQEADQFYRAVLPELPEELARIQRQAVA